MCIAEPEETSSLRFVVVDVSGTCEVRG
jgi:hypothetical protein